jgi:hypothetical protein
MRATDMSTAAASTWPCPQCRRRVPRREPVCHCGYARTTDSPAARPAGSEVALPPEIPRATVVAGIAVIAMVGVLVLAVVVQEIRRTGVEPVRGEVRYPALPMVPEKARPSLRRASRAITGPSVADVVEVSLRKIAADTSELELRYRPFAEACLAGAPDGGWLVALKKAPVRADVKVRDGGATVGCDVARWNLIARADVLKSDLAATESRARTDGLLPGRWRALLVKYELVSWERY